MGLAFLDQSAALTIAGGLAATLLKNLVHCALAVTVAFAGLALLFLELDAQFAGFVQILVYIGAVAILVVFAILLTRAARLRSRDEGVFSSTLVRRPGGRGGGVCGAGLGRAAERRRLCRQNAGTRCHSASDRRGADGPVCAAAWRLWRCC